MFLIYQILVSILLITSPIFILIRILKNKEDKKRYIEKYSVPSKEKKDGNLIWFHGASVGEILSIVPLIKFYEKGFGFDTFTGLPEDWDMGAIIEKAGSYSADGIMPEIEGGEFVVGKFEDSLPEFFSQERQVASLINFDSDIYSSTICALNYSQDIIDKETILIFDEFLVNENWEEDEYKALEEFCMQNNFSYEVLAVSFFSKQVAVKLTNKKDV